VGAESDRSSLTTTQSPQVAVAPPGSGGAVAPVPSTPGQTSAPAQKMTPVPAAPTSSQAGTGAQAMPPPAATPPPPAAAPPKPSFPFFGGGGAFGGFGLPAAVTATQFCDKYEAHCGFGGSQRYADRAACEQGYNGHSDQQACYNMHLDTAIDGSAAGCNGQ